MAEPIHMLFVDDDAIALAIAERMLRHQRHCLTCTTSPEEAIRLLNILSFDVVIVDIFMPEIDGYQLIQRIRKQPAHHDLIVIAASVRNCTDVRQNATRVGADVFLAKPLDWQAVVDITKRSYASREPSPVTSVDLIANA